MGARHKRPHSGLEVAVDSGSSTIIGVIIGVLLVIVIAVWAFGGFNRSEPDVAIDLPNVDINPPATPAP
jgi:hypothetical protein